jgi:hypothetical protein
MDQYVKVEPSAGLKKEGAGAGDEGSATDVRDPKDGGERINRTSRLDPKGVWDGRNYS